MSQVTQRKDYREVPNLNFIPGEHQKSLLPSRQLSLRVLLVVMIAFGVFIVTNLQQQRAALQAGINSAQRKMQQADSSLAAANSKMEEAKKLQTAIDAMKKELEATKQDWAELGEPVDWSRVMSTVFDYKSDGVELRSVATQETNRVTVSGTATDYAALLLYRNQLLLSPVVSRIISLNSSRAEASLSFSLVVEVKTGVK